MCVCIIIIIIKEEIMDLRGKGIQEELEGEREG